ncbi:nuclear transport factor 2 family protein [Nocardia sp. XZ_19_369]|uniref:nuclear transport factor 2 family protein n=1 Tax=Nocardia sp. XZ_19_369 TaxID=2769487 RepID=UPI00188EE480|nr:nuclear transport factor 2 family protein [Nocardia sp. XZ_19_369]
MDSAMDEATTTDAVARFRAAATARDFEAMMATLTPDATLISPVSGRMVFRGADDLRILLTTVYSGISGLRWTEQIGDGAHRVLLAEAALGPFRFTEALVLELADDGRIRTLKPHLRPWLSLTVLAMWLAPGMLKHPGVLRRAMRGASAP